MFQCNDCKLYFEHDIVTTKSGEELNWTNGCYYDTNKRLLHVIFGEEKLNETDNSFIRHNRQR